MKQLALTRRYRDWTINLAHFSLQHKKAGELFAEPRLMRLLAFLQSHEGRVVERNEIVRQVWGEVIVSDESLSKAVFDLRKFLDSTFMDAPRIVTIRSVGYQLVVAENGSRNNSQQIFRTLGRVTAYAAIGFVVLILLIRAIRY